MGKDGGLGQKSFPNKGGYITRERKGERLEGCSLLNGVSQNIWFHPEPQSVTLFGNRVSADVVKVRI